MGLERVFRILLIFTFFFNQIAWAMEDPHGGGAQARALRPLVLSAPLSPASGDDSSTAESLETRLLCFTEQGGTLMTASTLAVTTLTVRARPQSDSIGAVVVPLGTGDPSTATVATGEPHGLAAPSPAGVSQGNSSSIHGNSDLDLVPSSANPTPTGAASARETSERLDPSVGLDLRGFVA
jgi:hypothetical protein